MKKVLSILIAVMLLCVFPLSTNAKTVSNDTLMILKELEVLVGDANGNLNLSSNVTRAEFTKMAVKASKFRNSVALNLNISPYRDVTYKMWYAPYVKTASENALIKGYSDGSFKPQNTVLYEEGVTILLRLLGYTDSDFGVSWPYGQMGIAESIGLLDDVSCEIGSPMTRNDVAVLFGNFLTTYLKGSQNEYISSINYAIIEDVVLIATANEDTTVGSGKIVTSSGTYRINSYFDYSMVGKKGTAVFKNNDELALFLPDNQIINEYTVYQVLTNNVIVSKNGELTSINIGNDISVYNKSSRTTLRAVSSQLSVGDEIATYANENGVIDYGIVKTNALKGPYTVLSTSWMITYGITSPTVNRNGVKTTADSIKVNDIIYYSEKLNTVWAYSDTVTGIYENAFPNADSPATVQVSGVTYSLEGLDAFKKLSSGGEYTLGDTVTLLLGKDGGVADVKSKNTVSDYFFGYIVDTGTKNFTDSTGSYSSYYATIATADGEESTYAVKSDYSSMRNKVVSVTFNGKYANMSTVNSSTVSGTVSQSGKTIGSTSVLPDVKILEVSTTDVSEKSSYKRIYLPRLDGINLKSSQVLYSKKNAKGVVEELYIKDVTGDLYKYGIVTETPNSQGGIYRVDIGGSEVSISASSVLNLSKWQPCRVIYEGNSVKGLYPLTRLTTAVKNLTEVSLKSGSIEYLLSDKVLVYERNMDQTYRMISLKDLIGAQESYTITAYHDKAATLGGRIRVLLATPKTN